MTEQTETPTAEIAAPAGGIDWVKAGKGSRLEQLHEAYADAKATKADAEAKLKAITDALKVEMTKLAPDGARRIALTGGASSGATPLQLTYSETWRFDSKRFKVEDPVTYVRYAKKSGSWTLTEAKSGGEEQ